MALASRVVKVFKFRTMTVLKIRKTLKL